MTGDELSDSLQTQLLQMTAAKDGAYLERNQCVALIARMALAAGHAAGLARTAIEGWSEDWHGCVYIDLPTGQVSWHFHDSQAHLFAGLPAYAEAWDGHDTPEKYRRVNAAFPWPGNAQPDALARVRADQEFQCLEETLGPQLAAACPVCGARPSLWQHIERGGSVSKVVMCSNGEQIGPDDSLASGGCPFFMPPQSFYRATIREARAFWNSYAQALVQLRAVGSN